MKTPEDFVGAPLWTKMQQVYAEWVRNDSFGSGHRPPPSIGEPPVFNSVVELTNALMSAASQGGLRRNGKVVHFPLETPVKDFLLSKFVGSVGPGGSPVSDSLVHMFYVCLCEAHLDDLIWEANHQLQETAGWPRNAARLREAGAHDDEVLAGVRAFVRKSPLATQTLGSHLLEHVLLPHLEGKKLWDLFYTPFNQHGYRSWWSGAFSHAGQPLKERQVVSASGTVTIAVSRYTEDVGSSVKAYEWEAQLRCTPGSVDPDAVACGMVYVMAREDGMLASSPSDLRWAADAVADTDVSQVVAFLRQYNDVAEELMEQGDLCFVWMWERRKSSSKGLGQEVLASALQDLKKRFRRLHALIVRINPVQFSDEAQPWDPPELQVARAEACEKLEALLARQKPEEHLKGVLCPVLSRPLSPDETLATLGSMDIEDDERD